MKSKRIYLENEQKWRLKDAHEKSVILPYKEKAEYGWQFEVLIRKADVEAALKGGELHTGEITNINQLTSREKIRLVKVVDRRAKKIAKKAESKKAKRKNKPRWK